MEDTRNIYKNDGDSFAQESHQDQFTGVEAVYYKRDKTLNVNDRFIPLVRSTTHVHTSTTEEEALRTIKIGALKLLSENPGVDYSIKEIVDGVGVSMQSTVDLSAWWTYFMDGFCNDLEETGVMTSSILKTFVETRVYNVPSPINLLELDEDSGEVFLTNFECPNGSIIAGRAGRLASLLIRSSRERPVTQEDLKESGICSAQAIENRTRPDSSLLSGIVQVLRRNLDRVGEDSLAINRRLWGPERGAGKRKAAYWMEIVDPEKYALDQVKIEKSARLVEFFKIRKTYMKERGIKPLPTEVRQAYKGLVRASGRVKIEDKNEIIEYFNSVVESVKNVSDSLFETDIDDPRWALIDYIWELNERNQVEDMLDLLKQDLPYIKPRGY